VQANYGCVQCVYTQYTHYIMSIIGTTIVFRAVRDIGRSILSHIYIYTYNYIGQPCTVSAGRQVFRLFIVLYYILYCTIAVKSFCCIFQTITITHTMIISAAHSHENRQRWQLPLCRTIRTAAAVCACVLRGRTE